ncbi:MAG TPA: SMP-30/gluconolactonase/LRE family protein [Pyrinomonadaceae bacterium]|nr:SMP-30/gluconolactonase/LRE family protein [Pyrinomonadaceae bacterium]
MGLAEDSAGNVYVSDRDAKLIWKIEPSGRTTVIAGTGMTTGATGLPRNPVLARDVDFASIESIAVDGDGNLLLADSLNHAILKIDARGYLTYFAGNGERGFSGDAGQATQAQLHSPYDVRIDSKGNVYIADVKNHRIRKVDREGVISTVAGTGVAGYSGDGGPAVNAQLNMPYGILLDNDDNLLIADSDNNVIRKVGHDGNISTIAGTGERGYAGDGGPARAAKFDSPQAMAIDKDGRIYVDDEHNNAIRIIEPDGTLRTLVGTKGPGFSGDGGPAISAQIADPENILVRKDGSILISARDNSRLRIVSPDGIINTFAGKGPTSKHDYFAPITLPTVEP